MGRGSKVKFAPKPYSKGKKEGYQQLNLVGTPQHAAEVDDSVFLSENKLLGTYMEPNFKKQPYVPQAHEWTQKLNLFTGRNLKPLLDRPEKKENVPLFKPFKYDYLPNKNDVMERTLAMSSRYRDTTSTISKKFEKPTPEIKVAPGVDIGYNAEPTDRPYHPWYRTPEYNIDELRGEVRPSYEINRTKIGMKGDKGHFIPKKKNLKRRPEAIYGQGNQARVIPGIGTFSKGANDRLAGRIERMVKKPESVEHFGNEYREHDYTPLPENRKPFVEATRLHNRPDDTSRTGHAFTNRHEDMGYDRTMNIKPKNTKRMQFGHLISERDGNMKALVMVGPNDTQGKGMHKSLHNKSLSIKALRDGVIDVDYQKNPYTNKRTLLARTPQDYDTRRDHRPDTQEYGNRLRNENDMLLPESHAYTYIDGQRTVGGDMHLRAGRQNDKSQFKFMRNPIEYGEDDRRGVGHSSSKKTPNRGSKHGLRNGRVENLYVDNVQMTGRVGINHAQGSHQFTKAHAKQTKRENVAGTERFAGGGRMIGLEHRNNRTTKLNNKRPVTVNRQPIGQMAQKNYSDYDNQFVGLTRTNVNRSAADQQPIPYPRTPTAALYGLNNQIVMGANTRNDSKRGSVLTQSSRQSFLKPIMKFK